MQVACSLPYHALQAAAWEHARCCLDDQPSAVCSYCPVPPPSQASLADYPCATKGKDWSPEPKPAWTTLTPPGPPRPAAMLSSKLLHGRRPRGFSSDPNSRSSRAFTLPAGHSSASSRAGSPDAPALTRLFNHVKAGLAKLSSSLSHRAPCNRSAPDSLPSTNTGSLPSIDEAVPLMHACAHSASSGYASGLVAPHSFVLTSLKLRRAVRERMQQQGALQEERVALLAAGAHLDA